MKITYDKIADAMYLYLSNKEITRTVPISTSLVVDMDSRGSLVGIEILNVSSQIPGKIIKKSIKTGVPVFV